jgi:transcription initiation factor TFIIB
MTEKLQQASPRSPVAKKVNAFRAARSCGECGSDDLVEDDDFGEIICRHCGVVLNDHVASSGPDWRAYTPEERDAKAHAGPPISYSTHDKGLPTYIGRETRNKYGRALSPAQRQEVYALRRMQNKVSLQSSVAHNLRYAMTELDRLADQQHIPKPVQERAALIYRKALEKGAIRGRSIAAMAMAALYAACRLGKIPRSLSEFAMRRSDRKRLGRCYRLLVNKLDLRAPVDDPIRCVAKIATKLDISMRTQQRAIAILNEARAKGLVSGRGPMGLAAAALYLACLIEKEKTTQHDIAEAANVTEVTVRNRYKELKESSVFV